MEKGGLLLPSNSKKTSKTGDSNLHLSLHHDPAADRRLPRTTGLPVSFSDTKGNEFGAPGTLGFIRRKRPYREEHIGLWEWDACVFICIIHYLGSLFGPQIVKQKTLISQVKVLLST